MNNTYMLTACCGLLAGAANAQDPSITIGPAETIKTAIYECQGGRPTNVGRITATDGTEWTVPADTQFGSSPLAPDLYNECNGVTPSGAGDMDISAMPVVDAGGTEEFVAYLSHPGRWYGRFLNSSGLS